jgi:hypothetical protein
VDDERIEELTGTKPSGYDLKKMIKLCNELNDNYSRHNFYASAMLCRAIIDHIPPVFGFENFSEVANNYKSEKYPAAGRTAYRGIPPWVIITCTTL